ncbi:MAG: hypothetical protein CMJ46_04195 [Planctomyces sp.]|nr:hypothetical protein [Planctomyces sp.]
MGIMSQDYAFLPSLDDRDVIGAFAGGGFAHSAGVGRISHYFGFEGPSVAIDTASSSSLVAVIQAAQSLRDGHCHLALTGGANAILAPGNSLLLSKAGMLSPDGRCKSFSAAANGFGRGEGCGVLVLKRLRDAERDGDRVLALIRGGAVAHNGMSGGLTTPNTRSQVRIISDALKQAGLAPNEIQYLEAHGTGTEYGDPMELTAAASVLGKGRREPLLVGSVKANISHLEAAGGISGIIKTVLAMQHGILPRQLHFEEPSPHIPWQRLPLKMVTEQTDWPAAEERIAGVTALGLSGTNAHVILSSKPAPVESATPATPKPQSSQLLVLSAKSESALRRKANDYLTAFSSLTEDDFGDFCHTVSAGRVHFEYRAAVVADSMEAAIPSLRQLAGKENRTNGQSPGEVLKTGIARSAPKISWVFGDAEDFTTHLRQLAEFNTHVRAKFTSLLDQLPKEWSLSLTEDAPADRSRAQQEVDTFLFQVALIELWKGWGVEPESVMGFGVGQYAAACVAEVLTTEEALQLIVRRAKLREQFMDELRSGSENDALHQQLDEFEQFADTLNYFPPNRPLICSLSGEAVPVHRQLSGSYWRRHCVEPIKTEESWQTMLATDDELVINFSGSLRAPLNANVFEGLTTERTTSAQQLNLLAELYVRGARIRFQSLYPDNDFRKLSLPTYPFQRQNYWITDVRRYAKNETAAGVSESPVKLDEARGD